MKKVLIVMHSLGAGGAEKSLIAFLQGLNSPNYQVDLLLGDRQGMFLKQIPKQIHILDTPVDFMYYSSSLADAVKRKLSVRNLSRKLICSLKNKMRFSKKTISSSEFRWMIWCNKLKILQEKYDIAISYLDGAPNYFVIEKVRASKKILWVHNEFNKLGLHPEIQSRFLAKADIIVTVSKLCADDIVRNFPELSAKVKILENITSSYMIRNMAKEKIVDHEFYDESGFRIITVGRLAEQKGQDLAIEAADILRKEKRKFHWYFLGEGEWKKRLRTLVKKKELEGYITFLGIKENPYPYMSASQLLVQPSRYEGKSIVLDEAKILGIPILSTNYTTVSDNICHGVNGWITDIDADSIAQGITYLMEHPEIRKHFKERLLKEKLGNEEEIQKYKELLKQ